MISTIWIKIYAVVFFSGLAGALILTPVFRSLAAKTGFMDVPADNHKGHKKSTPLMGGLAMFFSWLLCIAGGIAAVKWNLIAAFSNIAETHIPGLLQISGNLCFIVFGAALAVFLGLIDD